MPLIRKLMNVMTLSEDERHAIQGLPRTYRRLAAREDITSEGHGSSQCSVILDGWACRFKTLQDGRRQILSLHLPGDIPDLQKLHLLAMEHSLGALTECTVACIPHHALRGLTEHFPAIAAALWRDTLLDAAILREWMVNIGRRSSTGRIAHLLCEIYTKLTAIGLAQDGRCRFPLTTGDLADATGLTAGDAGQVLRDLRARGLISLAGDELVIENWRALSELVGFDPTYLYLAPSMAGRTGLPDGAAFTKAPSVEPANRERCLPDAINGINQGQCRL